MTQSEIPTIEEQKDILRRIAERGLDTAQLRPEDAHWIDLWQHMLDQIELLPTHTMEEELRFLREDLRISHRKIVHTMVDLSSGRAYY